MNQQYRGYLRARAVQSFRPRTPVSNVVVVVVHGGGFVGGSIEDVAAVARALVERLALAAATPEYTLATEAPFPCAAEDVHAALRWAAGRARGVVVAGIEAGGNLAAAAAMMARDRGTPELLAQILVAPMLDPSLSSASMRCQPGAGRHGAQACGAWYRAYLPAAADCLHPYAAPASATRLAGLAPALVLTAADDPLRDEAESYAAKLIAAGVSTHVSRLARVETAANAWAPEVLDSIAAFLAPLIHDGT
jgi:acetyl esterase/lipase